MNRNHKILDHPILGYILLFLFAETLIVIGMYFDKFLAGYIPGYGTEGEAFGRTYIGASGIGCAIGAFLAVLLFTLWFRPQFKGCFSKTGIGIGLLFTLPVLIISFAGSIISIYQFGLGSVLIAFLKALSPGVGEEVATRGLGIANFMRIVRSEKEIKVVFWVSAVFFGLIHAPNALAGANVIVSILQAAGAIGIGMLFAAIYLRTGNLWPTIIAHTAIDFMEFCRADLGASSGVATELVIGDYLIMASAILAGIIGLLLFRKKYHPEILELWLEKWNRTGECENG